MTDTNQSTLYSHIQVIWKSDDTVKCIHLNGVHCKVWDVKCVNKNVMESGYTVKYDDIYAEKNQGTLWNVKLHMLENQGTL